MKQQTNRLEPLKDFARRMNSENKEQRKRDGTATIYATVGTALDKIPTADLAKWYIENVSEGGLRYYLEEQITRAVINEIKYNKH